ncbi:MAG: hypothetical protein ABEK16_06270 [Candidatus Nanohalobium sp.]
MALDRIRDLDPEKMLAAIFAGLTVILTFRLNSFWLFTGLSSYSALIGYVTGYTGRKIDSKIYRYVAYTVLLTLLILPFLAIVLETQCLAYQPYEARNIFTGKVKEFVHGGCGPLDSHPWYYQVTDSSTLDFQPANGTS